MCHLAKKKIKIQNSKQANRFLFQGDEMDKLHRCTHARTTGFFPPGLYEAAVKIIDDCHTPVSAGVWQCSSADYRTKIRPKDVEKKRWECVV